MELTYLQAGDWGELRIRGRLDAYWSDHFASALDERIRQGAHQLRLDLSEVVYLSSAGIRVLVRSYKQLHAIQGRLVVANPSEPVKQVLELSGLTALLVAPAGDESHQPAAARATAQHGNITFELFEADAKSRLHCRLVGDPRLLEGCRFAAADCRRVSFPDGSLGIGLGALGHGFDDCRDRFGEFLAVGGAAAYLPTDGTGVPDYLVAHGDAVPALEVCYAITCQGRPGWFARFESKTQDPIPLADLLASCLELAGAELAAVVLVAETHGLMGAALRRSPAHAAAEAPFAFPAIRDWLSFTAERAAPHALALVVGLAGRNAPPALTPFVRPLDERLVGHCHAAAFSYQPLAKGALELHPTVAGLFERQTLQGILHLLNDTRAIQGGGQSTFVRGACWIGAVSEVSA